MKLEQQVTSLELSKKLKEAGVPQYSVFDWWNNGDDFVLGMRFDDEHWHNSPHPIKRQNTEYYSAFTVAELGEMLSGDRDFFSGKNWTEDVFGCNAHRGRDYIHRVEAPTEADARARMLLHLIENDLIKI